MSSAIHISASSIAPYFFSLTLRSRSTRLLSTFNSRSVLFNNFCTRTSKFPVGFSWSRSSSLTFNQRSTMTTTAAAPQIVCKHNSPTDTIPMHNGVRLPIFGLGTFLASNSDELKDALRAALDVGYRYIDTAALYENEDVIGDVLQEYYDAGKLKRSDLFLATKLPFYGHEIPEHFIQASLKNLRTDYLDMYIIHMPFPCKIGPEKKPATDPSTGKYIPFTSQTHVDTWRVFEKYYKQGTFKSLGLSNFSQKQIQNVWDHAEIKPHNLQVEIHALFPQNALVAYCKKMGITVSAYAPLGSPGSTQFRHTDAKPEDMCLTLPLVTRLSQKYKKTPAQILIRQIIQRGLSTIPKSTKPKRVHENVNIFDFRLTDDEMKEFEKVPGRHRLFNFEFAQHHPWYVMKPTE